MRGGQSSASLRNKRKHEGNDLDSFSPAELVVVEQGDARKNKSAKRKKTLPTNEYDLRNYAPPKTYDTRIEILYNIQDLKWQLYWKLYTDYNNGLRIVSAITEKQIARIIKNFIGNVAEGIVKRAQTLHIGAWVNYMKRHMGSAIDSANISLNVYENIVQDIKKYINQVKDNVFRTTESFVALQKLTDLERKKGRESSRELINYVSQLASELIGVMAKLHEDIFKPSSRHSSGGSKRRRRRSSRRLTRSTRRWWSF